MIRPLRRLARRAALCALVAGMAACAAPFVPEAAANSVIAAGSGHDVADLAGVALEVFTYQPSGCRVSAILAVFHGVDRNAGPYRDDAIPLAQRYCMFVVAPLFDEARFPVWAYQRGGIVHGAVLPAASWTVNLVPRLVVWGRERQGLPELPYALIGHSAGAQFLSRVAAYGGSEARRIVIANPSTWVRPSLEIAAPYGFGGLYGPAEGEAALRHYLALPVTMLLGGEDTGSRHLATSEEAEAQGGTRLERGQTVFSEAELAARQRGWPFGWRLAVVPGVGHNAHRMFTSDAALDGLRLEH